MKFIMNSNAIKAETDNALLIKLPGSELCFWHPKRFCRRVFKDLSDLYFVNGASKRLEVVCSDVVQWVSEFRVYVVNSEIRKIAYCDGDREALPAMDVVQNAVKELESAGEGYAGYGIDFGVISTGETALIEMNDGYSLGAYGVSSTDYGELIFKRWVEIVSSGL